MKVGVTGHQKREGIDWTWVRQTVETELMKSPSSLVGFTSLAEGADQVFAEAVLECGGSLVAVVPTPDYERHFNTGSLEKYRALKAIATVKNLSPGATDQESFFNAGKSIVDHVEQLFAIWDGGPSRGLGGTADVVDYALGKSVPVTHINPITREVIPLR
jgi:hypothetical protein